MAPMPPPTCPTRPGGCARTEGAIGQDLALRTVQRDPGQAAGHLEHHIIQDAGPTDATAERAERSRRDEQRRGHRRGCKEREKCSRTHELCAWPAPPYK